jgi:MFS family permease
VIGHSQFRLLTAHYGLYQLGTALGGGFVGAYLLKLGFSMPAALMAYAALLLARFALRFVALGVVRAIGYRGAVVLGAAISATQFLPLMWAEDPIWLVVWIATVSLADSLYWPVYHSACAVIGADGSRGRELGLRTAIGAGVGILGPLVGGILLEHFGPGIGFGVAAALSLSSILPLLPMSAIPAGPVPSPADAMRGIDRTALATFAADGWMASGLAVAWPMVLFLSLGAHYEAFGMANAGAGLVGAVAGLLCGRAIDRGGRDRYVVIVTCALTGGFALRACAHWSPFAGTLANASGAAVMGLYVPVLMSVIYDKAKLSGSAYRFHFAAEAGWDMGAGMGCILAALVVWATQVPSLSMVPAVVGVFAMYRCIRGQSTRAKSAPARDVLAAG